MSMISLLVTVLPIVVILMIVAGVAIALRANATASARGSASYNVAAGSGVWFAQVRRGSRLDALGDPASGWGQLRVYGGQVSFTFDGAAAPAWTVPANQLRVQRPGSLSTEFQLDAPQIGTLTIEPSTSKISRWRSAGSWQGSDYRTTQDVVTILQGWGAH